MAIRATIQEILDAKGTQVYSLPPEALVFEAIQMMADRGVGALLVMQDEELVGIVSERDYARKVILKGKSSKETMAKEIMSSPVHFITADCSVDEAMSVMTRKRVRHLPVMSGDQVVGVISIGDLVRSIINAQAATIEHLHAYITGQYPG